MYFNNSSSCYSTSNLQTFRHYPDILQWATLILVTNTNSVLLWPTHNVIIVIVDSFMFVPVTKFAWNKNSWRSAMTGFDEAKNIGLASRADMFSKASIFQHRFWTVDLSWNGWDSLCILLNYAIIALDIKPLVFWIITQRVRKHTIVLASFDRVCNCNCIDARCVVLSCSLL